jgi:hypothetical protein
MKPGKLSIVGFAMAMLVLGSAGTANAGPANAPQQWWCPGQPIPRGVFWNMATCHEYHYVTGASGAQLPVPGPPKQCGGSPCG